MKFRSILILFSIGVVITACNKNTSDDHSDYSIHTDTEYASAWRNDKLGLMVHFGLYSMLGGVYHDQPISKGYSEQIMAHAPIPAAEYKSMAASFNPTAWSADSIAQLAVRGGFKSVVITAKHHDGFNLYDSQFSDFTITKATPFKRDIIKEMSEACSNAGLRFGVYYSLIDWNTPEGATTISTHNADTIAPTLHTLNLNQIRELCTNYGNLSEIWFDMGSLTISQSKEIRALVKDLQPDCMISGRLGNGQGDFVVLGDNQLVDYKIETPWQAVASIHKETWGYRSWQTPPNVEVVSQEILTNLTKAVFRGGNYLLNIGPKGDGSIVAAEKQIISKIGDWLTLHGEAIYHTRPFYIGEKNWGACTYNPPYIYAHVLKSPDEGKLIFYGLKGDFVTASTLLPPYHPITATRDGSTTIFDLGMAPLSFSPSTIFRIEQNQPDIPTPAKLNYANTQNKYELTYHNANLSWSEDGANYYATTPSVVAMSWDMAAPKEVPYEVLVYYTQQEKNKIVNLTINGHTEKLDLSKYKTFRQTDASNAAIPSNVYTQGPYSGLNMDSHPGPLSWAYAGEPWGQNGVNWKEVLNLEQGNFIDLKPEPMQSYYYLVSVLAYKPLNWIVALGSDDAFQAWLNGKLIHSSGYPQAESNVVFLDIPFEGETNALIIKHLNVKGDFKTFYSFLVDQIRFEKEVSFDKFIPQAINHVSLTLANPDHPTESLGTPNIKIVIQQKKK